MKRIRTDKVSILNPGGTDIGNDIRTAMDIWNKYRVPFPLSSLWTEQKHEENVFSYLEGLVSAAIEEHGVLNMANQSTIFHMCPFTVARHGPVAILECQTGPGCYKIPATMYRGVPVVRYNQIGRVQLPKQFIGGAHVLVSLDPDLLSHASCISKLVAPGGCLIALYSSTETTELAALASHSISPSVLAKDMERAGLHAVGTTHISKVTDWTACIADSEFVATVFRKENRGVSASTTVAMVHQENPHLRANNEAQYIYKYARQKTKDITPMLVERDACESLICNPRWSRLLMAIEFLTTVDDASRVMVTEFAAELAELFPRVVMVDNDNAEMLIALDCGYAQAVDLIRHVEPHEVLLAFNADDVAHGRIMRGKVFLMPFDDHKSTRVALQVGRNRSDTWSITPDIFRREMTAFHHQYRPSAYKYTGRLGPDFDDCYDCRTMQFIVTKYARRMRIAVDVAYERVRRAMA